MSNIFEFSDRSFDEFAKFYNKSPGKARKATSNVLNQFAFGTRNQAINEIHKSMTVRSPKFVASSIRVDKAKARDIDSQFARTGSIKKDRFSGWEEQSTGGTDDRTRSQSLLARTGGDWNKKVRPSNRLKPTRDYLSMDDFSLPSGQGQFPTYFRKIKKHHKNKPFLMTQRYKNMKRGMYKFKSNQLLLLQNFERDPSPVKKNPWMRRARDNYIKQADIPKIWEKAMAFLFKKKKF